MKRKGIFFSIEQAEAHQRKHGFPPLTKQGKTLVEVFDHAEKAKKQLRIGGRKMNKTEREFAVLLEAQKRAAEILDYKFEGVRLPWGDGMLFKADFAVLVPFTDHMHIKIKLIEVKGIHVWKHAIVRFKGCRAEWKDWFDFEFHQRRGDGSWQRLA